MSEQVERRLAAILSADVVGYTRLMHADEEGTLARPHAHRSELTEAKIAEYGGRIVKQMGDALSVSRSGERDPGAPLLRIGGVAVMGYTPAR